MKSILIKDTTREEREEIIKASLDCGGGCENCPVGSAAVALGTYIRIILTENARLKKSIWTICSNTVRTDKSNNSTKARIIPSLFIRWDYYFCNRIYIVTPWRLLSILHNHIHTAAMPLSSRQQFLQSLSL